MSPEQSGVTSGKTGTATRVTEQSLRRSRTLDAFSKAHPQRRFARRGTDWFPLILLSKDAAPALQIFVDALLDGFAHLVGEGHHQVSVVSGLG